MKKINSAKIKKIKLSDFDHESLSLVLKDLISRDRMAAAQLLKLVLDKYFEL